MVLLPKCGAILLCFLGATRVPSEAGPVREMLIEAVERGFGHVDGLSLGSVQYSVGTTC
jgi:hypothetical protein